MAVGKNALDKLAHQKGTRDDRDAGKVRGAYAVAWRVLPLLFAAYFAAYIDRGECGVCQPDHERGAGSECRAIRPGGRDCSSSAMSPAPCHPTWCLRGWAGALGCPS